MLVSPDLNKMKVIYPSALQMMHTVLISELVFSSVVVIVVVFAAAIIIIIIIIIIIHFVR